MVNIVQPIITNEVTYRILLIVRGEKVSHFHELLATIKVFWQTCAREYYENLQKLVTVEVFLGMKVKT